MNSKFTTFLLFCMFLTTTALAQSIGINNPTPDASAALDVVSTTKGFLAPRMTKAQRDAISSPATGLLIYQTDDTPGHYVYNGSAWAALSTPSQLEKITEDGKTGYRILGVDSSLYGNIGNNAVDMSYSSSLSTTRGATGAFSFSSGYNNISSGGNSVTFGGLNTSSGRSSIAFGERNNSFGNSSAVIGFWNYAESFAEAVVGLHNTRYTPQSLSSFNSNDRAFVVGIGSGSTERNDGLIVYKDGTLEFDKLTTAPTTTTDRFYVLNDKLHYNGAEIVGGGSELEKITENGNTGYRIFGVDTTNYGNIGDNAIDLSYQNSQSTSRGATGSFAFASGVWTTASSSGTTAMNIGSKALGYSSFAAGTFTTALGNHSTAFGSSTEANGQGSTTFGTGSKSNGSYSTAMGVNTIARSYGETVFGTFNTNYIPYDSAHFDIRDRVFVVGTGSDPFNPNDGLIVYKDGTLEFDKLTTAPTTTTDRFYVLNDKLHYNGAEVGGGAGGASELEKITENGKTGYRILGRDAANYGDIGADAVDLSFSGNASSTIGATGDHSFAFGVGTTSSGKYSIALGIAPTASGDNSVALGAYSNTSGNESIALGRINAKAFGEVAVGQLSTNYSPQSTTEYNSSDRAFTVGTGYFDTELGAPIPNDGLIVYKDGTLEFDKLTTAPTTTTDRFYVLNGEVHYNGAIIGGAFSDKRLKYDKGTFNKGLSIINNIKIHDFTWKEDNTADVGVFAQELYKAFPLAVIKGDDKDVSDPSEIETKWQVDYRRLVPVLISATQELSEKVEQLQAEKAQMAAQLAELSTLKNDIDALKALLNTSTANTITTGK